MLLKIATLYAERLMSDICLVVEGTEYPAHRLILCATSEVFQVWGIVLYLIYNLYTKTDLYQFLSSNAIISRIVYPTVET